MGRLRRLIQCSGDSKPSSTLYSISMKRIISFCRLADGLNMGSLWSLSVLQASSPEFRFFIILVNRRYVNAWSMHIGFL